ncbi:MAG: hypothetical protein IBX50_14380 [Marinospirillum sp.]|nr:hypothetical protein [Marinospirillum sp.]MBE0507875.1 hypothetical protein [Marinospirillum sp.]
MLNSKQLEARQLFDPAFPDARLDKWRQPKQLRKGYITASGEWIKPDLSQRMKTAIDSRTARAAEGQLFGYQSLDAGQVYYFQTQTSVEYQALFDLAISHFSGHLRLGRSRSAQYGRVKIQPVSDLHIQPRMHPSSTKELTLWLMADLALTDSLGKPCLQPLPELMGLPDGTQWLAGQSFIRTRSYSPYNAHRRCYDPERQVISRGSVLRFLLPSVPSPEELQSLQRIGRFQEQGLGRIAVNPQLIQTAQPVFEKPDAGSTVTAKAFSATPRPANSLLAQVLSTRLTEQQEDNQADQIARVLFQQLLSALDSARNWQGITSSEPLPEAPGRSQWGRIKDLASQHRNEPEVLWQKLISNDDAVIRARSGWQLELSPSETLDERVTDLLSAHQKSVLLPEILGRLAVLGLTTQWQNAIEGNKIFDKETT